MKKSLLTSLTMLCASLAYAGSGCGGCICGTGKTDHIQCNAVLANSCEDKCGDKKDGKSDHTQSKAVLAGGCGGCGDHKDKKDKAPKADFSENKTILANSCGGCGDKKDKKDGKSDFTAQLTAIV